MAAEFRGQIPEGGKLFSRLDLPLNQETPFNLADFGELEDDHMKSGQRNEPVRRIEGPFVALGKGESGLCPLRRAGHGRVCLSTVDARHRLLIDPTDLGRVKAIAGDLGFYIGAGTITFECGNLQIARLTKLEAGSSEPLSHDLLLVNDALREVWETRERLPWDGGELSVVSIEGLIVLKSIRESGQDEDDIRNPRSLLDEG